MKDYLIQLLNKIIDSPDIPAPTKNDVVRHFMLPKTETGSSQAPIEKPADSGKVGAVHRPTKQAIDLLNNPTMRQEAEAMTETLEGLDIPKNE